MSDNNLSQKKQKQYEEYVKAVTPVHSLPLNMCKAFFTGGVICVVGQVILNYADNPVSYTHLIQPELLRIHRSLLS